MISICIPLYNFDARPLVAALSEQMKGLHADCEIICIDDASDPEWKTIIDETGAMCQTFIRLNENVGRARIRNLFLLYARYHYLLFLDGDSLICNSEFLNNYCQIIRQVAPDVVCGGRVYPTVCPGRAQRLSWEYGTRCESKPAAIRKISPHNSFLTNNFLIRKSVLEQIRFDERLSAYGHEDTLFGFELKQKGIGILHTENAVLNGDVETNKRFLTKSEEAIFNLIQMSEFVPFYKDLINDISLLRFHSRIKKQGLELPVYLAFILSERFIKMLLSRGFVSLTLFNFYKTGVLIRAKRNSNYKNKN